MDSLLQMSSASSVHDHVEEKGSCGCGDCYDHNCEYEDATREDGERRDDDDNDDGSDLSPEEAKRSSPVAAPPGFIIFNLPPPLPPLEGLNIVTAASVPCSSASSPQPDMVLMESSKKWGYRDQRPHLSIKSLLYRQHSEAMTRFALQRDMSLPRSKSCGDGRSSAPPDDFDLCTRCCIPCDGKIKADGSEGHQHRDGKNLDDVDLDSNHLVSEALEHKNSMSGSSDGFLEERFRCGPFCMFLPSLSKGKHISSGRHRKKERLGSDSVSRIASLEKFECGSWASSAVQDREEDEEEEDCNDMYYDLPLEKITNEANDTNSPVKAAFVFEKDRKGGLKREGSKLSPRPSTPRHVRFLTSTQVSCPPSPSKLTAEQMSKD